MTTLPCRSRWIAIACVAGLSSMGSHSREDATGAEALVLAPLHVNRFATGANTGDSWTNALTSLSVALELVQPGQQVWVALGTYTPDVGVDPQTGNPDSDPRAVTFRMRSGTKLYGGFRGSEMSVAERPGPAHRTILSGEIGDPSVHDDNSYHVVFYDTDQGTGPFGVIDGFVIRDGAADGPVPPRSNGGGLLFLDSHRMPIYEGGAIEIRNTSFAENTASRLGGGVFADRAAAFFTGVTFLENRAVNGGGAYLTAYLGSRQGFSGCTFERNVAIGNGGGLCRLGGAPTFNHHLVRCVFNKNQAGGNGGAIYYDPQGSESRNGGWAVSDSLFTLNSAGGGGGMIWVGCGRVGNGFSVPEPYLRLINNTIAYNSAAAGGAIFMRQSGPIALVELENSILWGNTADPYPDVYGILVARNSLIPGNARGTNLSADPRFVDPDHGNYQLHPKSPARDFGRVNLLPVDSLDIDLDTDRNEPIPLDLHGRPRFDPGAVSVDLGAYQYSERVGSR